MDPGAKRLFKGPKGPLGPERSDFFKRPKGPLGPLGPPVAREIWEEASVQLVRAKVEAIVAGMGLDEEWALNILETGKGLKKGPETFLNISKTFQALFQGPCSETRAKIEKNQSEIAKDRENLAKPSRNQGNDLGKKMKSKQKYKNNNPKGARAKRAPFWGGALLFLLFQIFLFL